jgi:hypothetical protein
VQGAFQGLQSQSVGGSRRDVPTSGGVKAREEQERKQQADRFYQHGEAATHACGWRARPGTLDRARDSAGTRLAPPAGHIFFPGIA